MGHTTSHPDLMPFRCASFRKRRCAAWAVLCLAGPLAAIGADSAPPASPVSTGTQSAPGRPGQPESPLQQLYSEAMTAFQFGDYKIASGKLESVISQAPKDAKLETVYFTLGASYFNQKDYRKAIETLKSYLEKYPKGARVQDATLSIAQAHFVQKEYDEAAAVYGQLENAPQFREQALLYEGIACKEAGKTDQAVATFERLIRPEIRSAHGADAAILLAGIYAHQKLADKAMEVIQRARERSGFLDNISRLNVLAIEVGDALLQNSKPEEALACYRTVWSHDDVVRLQGERIAAAQRRIDANVQSFRAEPTRMVELIAINNQLKAGIEENKKLLAEFQKLPDFAPALLLRLANCFSQMGRNWEASIVYDEFLEKFPSDANRESALFGLIAMSTETGQVLKARALSEQYLKDFKSGSNAALVGYLLGVTPLQANDPATAETYLGRILAEQPASTYKEEMRFLLGNARFVQGKLDEALKDYLQYQSDYPNGTHSEEAAYRVALCGVLSGHYEVAMGQLEAYTRKYPHGEFRPDVQYRLAVCKYAASVFDEVVEDCKAWEREFGGDQALAEVLALKGDALAARNDDEAIPTYIRSFKAARNDEVLNYSLFAAQKLLQKKGDWARIGEMFREFVKEKPDHQTAVAAIYWIGKAMVHDGKAEEAKLFIAETIKKTIADPKRDAVEQLLTQLAQLCVRKKPAVQAEATPAASGSAVVAAERAAVPSPVPAVDPGVELDKLLGGAETAKSPTAGARLLFAKSELARLRRQNAEMEKNLQAIADGFKPADLSPMLLAQTGDYLLEKNQLEKASPLFQRLKDDYSKCDFVDYAYNGLGEIAYRKKDYPLALELFTDAIVKIGATQKLKEVSVGKAKTLLALNRLEEAKKGFEQIATMREWRGEATAFSVYSLGQIAQEKNDLPGAIANYQRVFVAYQRYLPWVAKAYLKSAECFEKMGKSKEALNTYREMLRNQKLSPFEEFETARKRLHDSGQASMDSFHYPQVRQPRTGTETAFSFCHPERSLRSEGPRDTTKSVQAPWSSLEADEPPSLPTEHERSFASRKPGTIESFTVYCGVLRSEDSAANEPARWRRALRCKGTESRLRALPHSSGSCPTINAAALDYPNQRVC